MTLEEFDLWSLENTVRYRIGRALWQINRPYGYLYFVQIETNTGWISCSSPAPLDKALEAAQNAFVLKSNGEI